MIYNNRSNKFQKLNKKDFHLESYYRGFDEQSIPLKLDGQVIGYQTKELNEEFINELRNNRLFSSAAVKKMTSSVKAKNLIPIYSSSNWAGDIIDTFTWVFRAMRGMLIGFYDGKRIVILIASLRSMFGQIGKRETFVILTHEHQHKFAGERSSYHKDMTVKKTLNEWYTHFIDSYFEGKEDPKTRKALMKFWTNIKLEYTSSNISNTIYNRLSKLKELSKIMASYESYSVINSMNALVDMVHGLYEGKFPSQFDAMTSGEEAYRKMGVDSKTMIFQEFVIASEVTAVTFSEKPELGNQSLAKYI